MGFLIFSVHFLLILVKRADIVFIIAIVSFFMPEEILWRGRTNENYLSG